MKRKLKFLNDKIEKEKKDWEKCERLREKEKSIMTAETEKKKTRVKKSQDCVQLQ